jgi:SSS family solute:Na+ symporter
LTLAFSTVMFFLLPVTLPLLVPSLSESPRFAVTNDTVTTITTRPAAPSDVARRDAEIGLWEQRVRDWVLEAGPQSEGAITEKFGPRPEPIAAGDLMEDRFTTGGKPIYFRDRIEVLEPNGECRAPNADDLVEIGRSEEDRTVVIRQQFRPDRRLRGFGRFNLGMLIYEGLGIDLKRQSNAALETLRLPTRLLLPFVVMILLSLVTPRGDREALDRYYVKMKTPVDPDPQADAAEVAASYRDPGRFDDRRLFPFLGLEFQKPKLLDIVGFIVASVICFGIIGITAWLANLGR